MKVLEKLKGGLSFLFDKIVKKEKCVYLTSIFLIIGAFAWFNLQLKHSAEMLKVHNDNSIMFIQLEQQNQDIDESFQIMGEQDKIIKILEGEIGKASDIIKEQEIILGKLIQYLKDIREWPPKIKPDRPSRTEA